MGRIAPDAGQLIPILHGRFRVAAAMMNAVAWLAIMLPLRFDGKGAWQAPPLANFGIGALE